MLRISSLSIVLGFGLFLGAPVEAQLDNNRALNDPNFFLQQLNQSNTPLRQAQNRISILSDGIRMAGQRGTVSIYRAYAGGYNGFTAVQRAKVGNAQAMARSIAPTQVVTPVSNLRNYPNFQPSISPNTYQTGHQTGFMYTSRYYGSGPRN